MRITAVVLNWRRPDDTIACVRSVQETAPDVEVIVVDNGSGDGSIEKMRASLDNVRFVENSGNRGYAGGNNAGIAVALETGCDAILILNNDVVVREGCVEALADGLEGEYGIAAPVSLRRDDPSICDFWRAEVDLPNLAVRAIGRDEPWRRPAEPDESDYATGSAFLAEASLMRQLGGFDERFFLVWEDVDFSLRALRDSYRRVIVIPHAEVLHGQSVSFGSADSALYRYLYTRNAFLIVEQHVKRRRRARTIEMITNRFRGGIEREQDPAVRAALERGLDDGLAGRFGPAPADLFA